LQYASYIGQYFSYHFSQMVLRVQQTKA